MDTDVRKVAHGVTIGGFLILAGVLAVMLLVQLREILAIIFLGFIVGITLLPVTEGANRLRFPRVISVLLIYSGIAGLLTLFVWYAIPTFAVEVEQFVERLEELEHWYTDLAATFGLPTLTELGGYLERWIGGMLPGIAQQALLVATVAGYVLLVFVVALFVTITHRPMRETVLLATAPRYRARVDEFMSLLANKLRRYVFATFIRMTVVGLITYIGLRIIGVPFAFLLAVLAFIFEILPIVGPWLAFLPALALALTQGPFEAIAVSVFYLIVQQLESYVLVPVVYGRETKTPSLLLLVAIMIGFPLMGLLGAVIALPVSIMLHTFMVEIVLPWRRRQVDAEHRVWRVSHETPGETPSKATSAPEQSEREESRT